MNYFKKTGLGIAIAMLLGAGAAFAAEKQKLSNINPDALRPEFLEEGGCFYDPEDNSIECEYEIKNVGKVENYSLTGTPPHLESSNYAGKIITEPATEKKLGSGKKTVFCVGECSKRTEKKQRIAVEAVEEKRQIEVTEEERRVNVGEPFSISLPVQRGVYGYGMTWGEPAIIGSVVEVASKALRPAAENGSIAQVGRKKIGGADFERHTFKAMLPGKAMVVFMRDMPNKNLYQIRILTVHVKRQQAASGA